VSTINIGDLTTHEVTDLRQLVDVDRLQQIQDEFAAETGLAMITVDSMGSPVTRASEFSEFCQFLRRDPAVRRLCYTCDAHGGFQSSLEGRPVVYQCHAGLVDFSVSITTGNRFLGAVLAGQVLLKSGQDKLQQLLTAKEAWRGDPEIEELTRNLKVVDLEKLHKAADAIISLANETLGRAHPTMVIASGPYLGRLPGIPSATGHDRTVLAPLLEGRSKALPLMPIESPPSTLDSARVARNLHRRKVADNLEIVSRHLDDLLPRWSQKIPRDDLTPFEDMLIGVATSEGLQYGRDLTVEVMRNRGSRRSPMNRYECQLYCERLVIKLHDLVEPRLTVKDRTVDTLINEIEKDPTSFLTVQSAANYLVLSESHFARQFKQHTGHSFNSYVSAKRLDRAKLLLAHTTKPVLRIATELDFQPVNYFSRCFKKHFGITPSQYRNQFSGGTA